MLPLLIIIISTVMMAITGRGAKGKRRRRQCGSGGGREYYQEVDNETTARWHDCVMVEEMAGKLGTSTTKIQIQMSLNGNTDLALPHRNSYRLEIIEEGRATFS